VKRLPATDPALFADYEILHRAEPELLSLLLRFLDEKGYYFDPDLGEIFARHKGLERFKWRPEAKGIFMSDKDPAKNRLTSAFHPAAHALVYYAFGGAEPEFPRMNLLGEAIASALDFYFFVSVERAVGEKRLGRAASMRFGKELRSIYQAGADRSGIDLAGFLRRHSKKPFHAFRGAVREQHSLSIAFLKSWDDRYEAVATRISRLVGKCELIPYLEFNDYTNNLLYTAANYGLKSSRQDLQREKQLLALLDRASSAPEFFGALRDLSLKA
jgi:hypothetical protein